MLGAVSVILAWRLGVDAFAPVSALLILNSLAVTASDLGLGTEVLRKRTGTVARATRAVMRCVNITVVVIGCAIAFGLYGGTARILVVGTVAIWFVSAEAQLGKSAALASGRVSSASVAELLGTIVLAAGLVAAVVSPADALIAMVIALAGKHGVEAIWVHRSHDVFAAMGGWRWRPSVWIGRVLSYAVGNVDYLVVGALFSAELFSIYTLAFRVASFAIAQVAYVVGRVALVDFGQSATAEHLDRSYRERVRQLLGWGGLIAAVTALCAPLLPLVLGSEWMPVVGVIVVLAIATPWRMTTGLGGMVGLATEVTRRLATWEAIRLVLYAGVLVVAAQIGFEWFVASASVGAILTSVAYDTFARKYGRISGARLIRSCALPVIVVVLVLAFTVVTTH